MANSFLGRLSERALRRIPYVRALIEANHALGHQRDTLALERDGLKAHVQRLAGELEEAARKRLWAAPGHFYSPIADPASPEVRAICARTERRTELACELVGPEVERNMVELFSRISRHYGEIPFHPRPSAGLRYYYENPNFGYADGITLYGMLRELRPRRLIEVGIGFSSCATMDTNDLFLGGSLDVRFIDPYPETLLALLGPDDPYRQRVTTARLQEVPTGEFSALAENDILFIDSSHVSKMGSDVNDYMFRILPALKPGVIVHIHDILYPFEYPAAWIQQENRSWNEAYLVRAFLEYNERFEVLFFNDFFYGKHRDSTERHMPLCLRNTGGSLWLRKSGG